MVKIPMPFDGVPLSYIKKMSKDVFYRKLDDYINVLKGLRKDIHDDGDVEKALDRCLLLYIEHAVSRLEEIMLMREPC